jgi:hypothetical protein
MTSANPPNVQVAAAALVSHLQQSYDLPHPLSCALIRRGFNDTYLVEFPGGKHVFRLYFNHKYWISGPGDFRFELELLRFVHARGVAVAVPIPRRDGDLLGTFPTASGDRFCALFAFAELAALSRRRGPGPLALLHGDCGAHNFVTRGGSLAAVIDPRPVAGEPIWDLAMAFVSWPGALTLDTILPAAESLERAGLWHPAPGTRHRVLVEEVLIALYAWIGVAGKHILEELPAYVAAWSEWTKPSTRESVSGATRIVPGAASCSMRAARWTVWPIAV